MRRNRISIQWTVISSSEVNQKTQTRKTTRTHTERGRMKIFEFPLATFQFLIHSYPPTTWLDCGLTMPSSSSISDWGSAALSNVEQRNRKSSNPLVRELPSSSSSILKSPQISTPAFNKPSPKTQNHFKVYESSSLTEIRDITYLGEAEIFSPVF